MVPSMSATIQTGFDDEGALDSFLPAILAEVPHGWVLISRLDSDDANPSSETIRSATARFASEVEWTDAGLLVPTGRISELLDATSLFFGFDEVVIFEDRPAARLASAPPIFTTDHEPLATETERRINEYLEASSARAIAADGVGVRWFRYS